MLFTTTARIASAKKPWRMGIVQSSLTKSSCLFPRGRASLNHCRGFLFLIFFVSSLSQRSSLPPSLFHRVSHLILLLSFESWIETLAFLPPWQIIVCQIFRLFLLVIITSIVQDLRGFRRIVSSLLGFFFLQNNCHFDTLWRFWCLVWMSQRQLSVGVSCPVNDNYHSLPKYYLLLAATIRKKEEEKKKSENRPGQ